MLRKLAIVSTHPIQYYAPVFQLLNKQCNLKVFYTWGKAGIEEKYDPDFKAIISWDIPLLEGYNYEFLENTSKEPGSHHFKGIENPAILSRISDFNPDAILVYGWSYKSHLKTLRYFKGKIPIWFRGDSNLLDPKSKLKKILRMLSLRWVYKHIDKAFYVGSANKEYYKSFGLKENQLIFAPHAIDNDRFSLNHTQEVEELRNSLRILPEEILILFAGKLESKKNPELLLTAFSELKLKNVHLLFVGNGELRPSLEETVKNENLSSTVHFIDFQNQSKMPIVYQSCNLFCLPSRGPGETWGLAVNEAMAATKAILVSNRVGCAKDLVKDSENGYIFESDNLLDLKTKLTKLLGDPKMLKEMGIESAKKIRNWSFKAQADSMIKVLNNGK